MNISSEQLVSATGLPILLVLGFHLGLVSAGLSIVFGVSPSILQLGVNLFTRFKSISIRGGGGWDNNISVDVISASGKRVGAWRT